MAQESTFSLNSKGEALLRFFLYLYKNINGKERLWVLWEITGPIFWKHLHWWCYPWTRRAVSSNDLSFIDDKRVPWWKVQLARMMDDTLAEDCGIKYANSTMFPLYTSCYIRWQRTRSWSSKTRLAKNSIHLSILFRMFLVFTSTRSLLPFEFWSVNLVCVLFRIFLVFTSTRSLLPFEFWRVNLVCKKNKRRNIGYTRPRARQQRQNCRLNFG